jgi:tRNA A-37 threonylcarbamoyl transferase component Bud32/tetratricopeptide (TPR) repeat protein
MLEHIGRISDEMLDRQRRLWSDGRPPAVEDLLRESGCEGDPEARLDLLYNEIVIRDELGLGPTLAEYVGRYPELEQDLRLHFEVHQAVRQQLLLETASLHAHESWLRSTRLPERSAKTAHGEYELQGLIGEGGMAAVYSARHRRLRREVALKLLQPGRKLTQREVARIRTEAEAMARLAHPNIVQIFEIGESQGAPFLALELVEGGTLAAKLQLAPPTHADAASLIELLARAVHHAHEREVIHRDLKPANILYTHDGVPKITDFGLAKVLEERDVSPEDLTRTGDTLGTPRYMAPEQAAGQHNRVGPATDVYALGTLLYECLAGRAPFVSPSVLETLRQIREDDPLPPRRWQASIPRDLETICLHCLQKDPHRRYASAHELAEDLRRFQQHEPVRIRPTPAWERAAKWCRKRPARATWIALAALLCVGSVSSAVGLTYGESWRIAGLRRDVADLVRSGREALERDELEVAQGRFLAAWQKVQGEPALADHQTSVAGWLDHSRSAINRYHWKQRVPPRDFDSRRDEALLLSVLQFPHLPEPAEAAREAIQAALELAPAHTFAWQLEREQLVLLEAEMLARTTGEAGALAWLDETAEGNSHLFHVRRTELLRSLGREREADRAHAEAERHPASPTAVRFHRGLALARDEQFPAALAEFEAVLEREPAHFAARLLQAVCFVKLQRPAEALVGLTACIAQSPRFAASPLLRGQARAALGDEKLAQRDFETALALRPSDPVRLAALTELT